MVGVFSPVNAVYKAAKVPEKCSWFRCQVRYPSHPTETQTDKRDGPNTGTECTRIRNDIKTHLLWCLFCHQPRCSRPWGGHLWSGPVISGTGTLAVVHSGLVGFGRGGSAQAMVALHTMNARLEWDLGSCLGHFVMSLYPFLDGICDVLPWASRCNWGLVFCHNHLLICRIVLLSCDLIKTFSVCTAMWLLLMY